jgi:hypothetical protein
MATVTNAQIKFQFLQSVLASYIGKIYNDEEMEKDYNSNAHDALISAIWSAFVNGQYDTSTIELEKCNKVAMIKALRARVQGIIKLDIKLPSAWNQNLRDAILDNTRYHPDDDTVLADVTKRQYCYAKSIGLKEAKDFCDWMVALMLDQ